MIEPEKAVVDEIKQHGRVIRGYVGLVPDELTRAEAMAMGTPDPNIGIILQSVYPDGPAAAAGLRRGDVVLAIDGEAIRSSQQALLLVAAMEPGDDVVVTAWRDGAAFEATITVTERRPLP